MNLCQFTLADNLAYCTVPAVRLMPHMFPRVLGLNISSRIWHEHLSQIINDDHLSAMKNILFSLAISMLSHVFLINLSDGEHPCPSAIFFKRKKQSKRLSIIWFFWLRKSRSLRYRAFWVLVWIVSFDTDVQSLLEWMFTHSCYAIFTYLCKIHNFTKSTSNPINHI